MLDITTFNEKKYSGNYSYLECGDDKVAVFVSTDSGNENITGVYCYNWTQEDKDEYPTYTFIDV